MVDFQHQLGLRVCVFGGVSGGSAFQMEEPVVSTADGSPVPVSLVQGEGWGQTERGGGADWLSHQRHPSSLPSAL